MFRVSLTRRAGRAVRSARALTSETASAPVTPGSTGGSVSASSAAFLRWGKEHGSFVLGITTTLVGAGSLVYGWTATTSTLRADLGKEKELRAKDNALLAKDIAQEKELRAKDSALLAKDIAQEKELRAMDVQLSRAETISEMRGLVLDLAAHGDYEAFRQRLKDLLADGNKL